MKPSQALRRARALIETHGWIQGGYGDDDTGYCAVGAITCPELSQYDTCALNWFYCAAGYSRLTLWNDAPERTVDEVLATFDLAAYLAEECGE